MTDAPEIDALPDGRISPQDAEARGLDRFYGVPADVAGVSSPLDQIVPDHVTRRSR